MFISNRFYRASIVPAVGLAPSQYHGWGTTQRREWILDELRNIFCTAISLSYSVISMLILFLLWLTHFIPLRTKVVNRLPAVTCNTVAWGNLETYKRNVLGEDEFAKFSSKTNVAQICNIVNNLGF